MTFKVSSFRYFLSVLVPLLCIGASACTNIQEPLDIGGQAITTQPPNGATEVPLDATISATFHPDIEIDESTLTASTVWLLKEGVAPRTITINFDPDTNQLVIDHDLLEEGSSYTVALTNYITSENGDSLGSLIRSSEPEREPAPEATQPVATPTQQTPTLAPKFGSLGTLTQSGDSNLVNAVANTAYAWTFSTGGPSTDVGTTEPETVTSVQPQPDGSACTQDAECINRVCEQNVCQPPSCDDEKKNGNETDNDCGGPTCTTQCEIGKLCLTDNDCQTQVCDSSSGTCAVPADNSVADGGFCIDDMQCVSGRCDTNLNECLEATCGDGIQNQGESDQDCGGPCDGCDEGRHCDAQDDCAAFLSCGLDDRCIMIGEAAVDNGGFCTHMAHCKSRVCVDNVCQDESCSDDELNQQEADIDCGGPNCSPCEIGKGCQQNSDCESGFCEGFHCVEAHDLVDGASCSANEECRSGVCFNGSCAMIKRWGNAEKIGEDNYNYSHPALGIAGVGQSREGFSIHMKRIIDPNDKAKHTYEGDFDDLEVKTAPGCSAFLAHRSRSNWRDYGRPAVAHSSTGKAVAVWSEREGQSNSKYHIYARHFTSGVNDSAAEKKVFPLHFNANDPLQYLDVAIDDDGNAFLAWQNYTYSPSEKDITWSAWYNASTGTWEDQGIHYWLPDWGPTFSRSGASAEHDDIGDAGPAKVAIDGQHRGVIAWPQEIRGRDVLQAFLFDPSTSPTYRWKFMGVLDEGSGWGDSSDVQLIYDHKNDEFIAVWLQHKDAISRKVLRWAKTSNHEWQSPQEVVDPQQRPNDVTDSDPSLAIDDSGNWIVTWKVRGPAIQGIMARRYEDTSNNWDGPPAAISIAANSGSTDLINPTVVMNGATKEALIVYKYQEGHVSNHSLIARSYNTWTGWEPGLGQVISAPTNYIDDDFAALYDDVSNIAVVVWAQKPDGTGGQPPHVLYTNSFMIRPTP